MESKLDWIEQKECHSMDIAWINNSETNKAGDASKSLLNIILIIGNISVQNIGHGESPYRAQLVYQ